MNGCSMLQLRRNMVGFQWGSWGSQVLVENVQGFRFLWGQDIKEASPENVPQPPYERIPPRGLDLALGKKTVTTVSLNRDTDSWGARGSRGRVGLGNAVHICTQI